MLALNLFFSIQRLIWMILFNLVMISMLSSPWGKASDHIYDMTNGTEAALESCARYCINSPNCKAWYYQYTANNSKCAILSPDSHSKVLLQPALIEHNNQGCYGIITDSKQLHKPKGHSAFKTISILGDYPLIITTPTVYHQYIPRLDFASQSKANIQITPKAYTISLWVWLYKPASHMQAIFTTHSLTFYPKDYHGDKKPIFLPSVLIHLSKHPNQFFFSFQRDDHDSNDFVGLWAGTVQYRQWMNLVITVDETHTARMYLNGEYLDYLSLFKHSPNSEKSEMLHNVTETSMLVRCGHFNGSHLPYTKPNADTKTPNNWQTVSIVNKGNNNDNINNNSREDSGIEEKILLIVGDTGQHTHRMRGLIRQFHIHMHQTWSSTYISENYRTSKDSLTSSSFMSYDLHQQLTDALYLNSHINNKETDADEAFQCAICRFVPVSFNTSSESLSEKRPELAVKMRWICGSSLLDPHFSGEVRTGDSADSRVLTAPWSYSDTGDTPANSVSLLAYSGHDNKKKKINGQIDKKSAKVRDIGHAEDTDDNDETDDLILSVSSRHMDATDSLEEEEVVIDLDFVEELLEKEQERLLFHSKSDSHDTDEDTDEDTDTSRAKILLMKRNRAQVRCLYLAARRAIRRTHVLQASVSSLTRDKRDKAETAEFKSDKMDEGTNTAVSFPSSQQPFQVFLREQYEHEMKRIPSILFATLLLADELRDTPLDTTATHFPARRHEMDAALSQPVSLLLAQHIHNVYDTLKQHLTTPTRINSNSDFSSDNVNINNNINDNNIDDSNTDNNSYGTTETDHVDNVNRTGVNTVKKSLLWQQIEANDREIAAAGGVSYILFARPPYATRTLNKDTIRNISSANAANMNKENVQCFRRLLQIATHRLNLSTGSLAEHLNNSVETTSNLQVTIGEILETVFQSGSMNPIYLETQRLCQGRNVSQLLSQFEDHLYVSHLQLNRSSSFVSRPSFFFETSSSLYRTISSEANDNDSDDTGATHNDTDDTLRLLLSLETALLSPSAIYVGFTFGQRHSGVYAMQSVRLSQSSVSQELDVSHIPLVVTGLIAAASRHLWHSIQNGFNFSSNVSSSDRFNNDQHSREATDKSSLSGLWRRNKDHLGQKGVADIGHMHTEANAEQLQDPESMVWLGKQYFWGFGGFDRNETQARHWFARAATLGHAEGMYNLAAAILRDVRHTAQEILLRRRTQRPLYYTEHETGELHDEGLARVKSEETLVLTEVETALHWLNKSATHRDTPFAFALQALGSHCVHHTVIVEGLSEVLRRDTLETLLTQGDTEQETHSNVSVSRPWRRHVTLGLHYFTVAVETQRHTDALFTIGATLLDDFAPIHSQIVQAFQTLGLRPETLTTLALLFLCRAAEAGHVSSMRYLLVSLRDYRSWLHIHYLSEMRDTDSDVRHTWSRLYDTLRHSYVQDVHSNRSNYSEVFTEQEQLWQKEAQQLLVRWHKLLQLPLSSVDNDDDTLGRVKTQPFSGVSASGDTDGRSNVSSAVMSTVLSQIHCTRLRFVPLEDDTVFFATTSALPVHLLRGVTHVPCLPVTSQYMSVHSSALYVHKELTDIQYSLARKLADFVPRVRDTYVAAIAAYVRDDTALAVSLFDEAADLGHGVSAMNAVFLYEELAATHVSGDTAVSDETQTKTETDTPRYAPNRDKQEDETAAVSLSSSRSSVDNNVNNNNIINNNVDNIINDDDINNIIINDINFINDNSIISVNYHKNQKRQSLTRRQVYEGLAQRRWRSLHSQQTSLSSLVRLSLQPFQNTDAFVSNNADSGYFESATQLEDVTATTGAVAGVLQLAQLCLALVDDYVVPFVTQCLATEDERQNVRCDAQYLQISRILRNIPSDSVLRHCVSPPSDVSHDPNDTNFNNDTSLIQSVYFSQKHFNSTSFSLVQLVCHLCRGTVMDNNHNQSSVYYSIGLVHKVHDRVRSLSLLALRYEGGLLPDVSPGVAQVHSHGIAPVLLYVHTWIRESLLILSIVVYQSTFCFCFNWFETLLLFWDKNVGLERDVWMTLILFVAILATGLPHVIGWPLRHIDDNEEERENDEQDLNNDNNNDNNNQ